MTDHELHISKRLKALLPPLTKEERKQLEANLIADGRVIDPILFWHDGTRDVIIDGMNRYPIAKNHGLVFGVERVLSSATTYEEAEEWIWDHQAGRRNLSREAIGKWYNRVKAPMGGDHTSKQANARLLDAAKHIAEKTGKDPATVRRAGKRADTLEGCSPVIQRAVGSGTLKASDADLKSLSKLPTADQQTVATTIRKGRAKSVKEAMKLDGITAATKQTYGKCPTCAGTKWTENGDGVSCAKCNHPHGEPAGDPDEIRIKTQRQKTVKTIEALMRAFDDLQTMKARPEHAGVIADCKRFLNIAKGWK